MGTLFGCTQTKSHHEPPGRRPATATTAATRATGGDTATTTATATRATATTGTARATATATRATATATRATATPAAMATSTKADGILCMSGAALILTPSFLSQPNPKCPGVFCFFFVTYLEV